MSVDVNLFVDDAVQQLVGVAVAGLGRRFVVGDLSLAICGRTVFSSCFAWSIAWPRVWLSMTNFITRIAPRFAGRSGGWCSVLAE